MAFSDIYRHQVELLIRTLPCVAEEECFSLKGGTAINLFVRDMPRLSVDIDLTYLPMGNREQALTEIDVSLKRIAKWIKNHDQSIHVIESAPQTQDTINKLVVRTRDRVQIKIEVTPVFRGCVYEPKLTTITPSAETVFGFAEISVLSFADLYAGKILAALDRQHPRDLFDIHLLLNNEGITEELRTAFIIYLISHGRPPHVLLKPNLKDIKQEFEQNFVGMTDDEIALETLLKARTDLVANIVTNMPDEHREFLLVFFDGTSDWRLLNVGESVSELPAIRWRESKLDNMDQQTRTATFRELEKVIGG